ncbi:MAG TPA: cation-translocating P-type ATPase [Planctomycetota bacterium]|nr:cation-translocating P-type ATPase [Planctomycetota bacterium]
MSTTCCNHQPGKDTQPEGEARPNGGKPSPKGINSSQVNIPIAGMHCPACALNIEKSLLCVNGVMEANVNFIDEKVAVRYDPYRTDIEHIKKAITRPGYIIRETIWEKTRAYWAERIFFAQMALCAVLVIAANLVDLLHLSPNPLVWKLTLSNLFALGVIIIGGYTILKGAIQALLVKDLTVFTLVSIASIAAVIVGAYNEAAMVILIMLIGETLERFALRQSRKAVTKLLNLTPVSALVKRDGTEIEIPAESVKVDDIVIIKSGMRIPVDGVVVKGNAAINESALTGESLPVDKKESDTVYSGTINEGNAFEMKATRTGDDTKFALIKRMILEAESQKAPIQRVADRYAKYFVPMILLFSLGVYLVYRLYYHDLNAIYTAITILIVACPCALVLATPTAVVTGLANASRKGILIKGGHYLEALGSLDALLIDKTGTLTTGKLAVTDIVPLESNTEQDVLLLAGLAERRSEHPIARAVLNKVAELKITLPEPETCEIFKGSGIKATCKDKIVIVGNSRLIIEEKINITPAVNEIISRLENQGKTTLLVVRDTSIVGIIGVTDTIKPQAAEAIQMIKQSGIKKIAIITGDNQRVASAIAQQAGVAEFYAGMLPEDKVNKLKELKAQGFKVGMVGDGVNDAPALAASDVGLAMGAFGSDVAIEAADVSLMSDDLSKIPQAIALSRRVLGVIRQNFAFSILYNIAMMVVVTRFVHHQDNMIWGAMAHQLSSLLVIANSLRLLR